MASMHRSLQCTILRVVISTDDDAVNKAKMERSSIGLLFSALAPAFFFLFFCINKKNPQCSKCCHCKLEAGVNV